MDKKIIYTIVAFIVIIVLGFGVWIILENNKIEESSLIIEDESSLIGELTNKEAELAGLNFILDFITMAPPSSDPDAMERAYNALSRSAKEQVSRESLAGDMALFVGVQDVPDQGISIEDFIVVSDVQANLIIELDYSGGRVLRNINLIVEDGEWKIDSISEVSGESSILPSYEILAVEKLVFFVSEQLEVEKDLIDIVSATEKEWPDGCLGLGEVDEMCTMAIVPGYQIVLNIEGVRRTYRTDMDGEIIREDLSNLQ